MYEIIKISIPNDIVKETKIIIYEMNGRSYPILIVDKSSYIRDVKIDSSINISEQTFMEGIHNIHVGKFCSIESDCYLTINRDHDYKSVTTSITKLINRNSKFKTKQKGQIIIENDVWIGQSCNIISGVTIHNGAVVAANSNVVKDVPPYAIVGGNPAKVIGYRFDKEIIDKLLVIQWWDWSNKKIVENNKYFNGSIEEFINKFYDEALLEQKKIEEINIDIPSNNDVYIHHIDFDDKFSLWDKVIPEFVNTFKDDENKMLLLFVDEDFKNNEPEVYDNFNSYLVELLNNYNAVCKINFVLTSNTYEEKALFKYANYLITDRSKDTIRYCCYADMNNVKIISGVDIPIFLDAPNSDDIDEKEKRAYNKYFALGNSITKHPIVEYWWGNYGMAASCREKDYVHLVGKELALRNKDVKVDAFNFCEWERSTDRVLELKKLDCYLTKDTDLVTILLGENIQDITNLEVDFIQLVSYIREKCSNDVKIIMLGMFWQNKEIDIIKERVSNQLNIQFLELHSKYFDDYYFSKLNNDVQGDDNMLHKINNPFVAKHPGDLGMIAISQEIIKNI